jgi:hypothetical protein
VHLVEIIIVELCTVIEYGVLVGMLDSLMLVEFSLRSFEVAAYLRSQCSNDRSYIIY